MMKNPAMVTACTAMLAITGMLMAAENVAKNAPVGWSTAAPRDEIKPLFRYEPTGGRGGREAFIISGDQRDGTSGWGQKTFDIEGGKAYSFSAGRKLEGVDPGRRSGLVRLQWRDEKDNTVKRDEPPAGRYLH